MALEALAANELVRTEAKWTWQPAILFCCGNQDTCHSASVILPLQLVDGDVGAGVMWNGDPLEPPVIPAKAGIHVATMVLPLCTSPSGLELLGSNESNFPLDSRFRGNDQVSQMTPIPRWLCLRNGV